MLKQKSKSSFIIISILFFYMSNNLVGQEQNEKWTDKLVFGGNIGFQVGSVTRIDLSPEVGYKITDQLVSGVGITYEYYKWKLFDYNTSLYGAKVFSRYFFLENIFAHAEYEALSLETYVFDVQNLHPNEERYWINSVFIGGGYKQAIGKNSAIILSALWNINDTPDSPYENPLIRVGFVF